LLSKNNFEFLYVRECQLKGVLQHNGDLQTYLLQYANRMFFENEKQTQLFELFWEKYPYLHSTLKVENRKFTYETNFNEDVVKCIEHVEHDFKHEIQDYTFNNEQLNVFELLIKQSTSLHILEGTLGSGKAFLIKYLTQYFQMKNKNVLLTTTIGVVTLRLFQNA